MVYGSDPGYVTAKDTVGHQCQLHDCEQCEEGATSTACRQQELAETQKLFNDPCSDYYKRSTHSETGISSAETTVLPHEHKLQHPSSIYYSSVWRSKYCDTCHLYPPIRSHHCRQCDRCVATFDHHCTFIGTCIGERNHCRFYSFLTFQTLGFVTCISIVNSSTAATMSIDTSPWHYLSVLAIKVYLYPLTFISLILWFSHSWFALCNVTTFECGKGSRHIDYLSGTKLCDTPFSRVRAIV